METPRPVQRVEQAGVKERLLDMVTNANTLEDLAGVKKESLELGDAERMEVHRAIVRRFEQKILVDAVQSLSK